MSFAMKPPNSDGRDIRVFAKGERALFLVAASLGLLTPTILPRAADAAELAANEQPSSAATTDSNFLDRLFSAYKNEWGVAEPPSDPNAPLGRRADLPPAPLTQPPYPFTEYSFGGTNPIGATLPSSVDSPLMTALTPTEIGKWLNDNHIQIYGWINPGFNLGTAKSQPGALLGGNYPATYYYQPNTLQLDQLVLNFERLPDTVQKDHIDWGFHVSPLFGETYRYTTSFGFFSEQLQKWNKFVGYDIPMIYGELYVPWVADGMVIRAGRYVSLPDIEAQLAPNTYMYSHSMTYDFDNYTNTGVVASVQANKNLMLQAGVVIGTETAFWSARQVSYPAVPGGVLYQPVPGVFALTSPQAPYSGQADPGVQPSLTACGRYQNDAATDALYLCVNGLNGGTYGYNNLQWYGGTYFHKFDDNWHIAVEAWQMRQNNVPNQSSPFYGAVPSPFAYMVNGPNPAQCPGDIQPSCTAREWSSVAYLNYKFSPLDNISWRAEYFDDIAGQRTGVKTAYFNYGVGWQHWFSPTVEIRPEIAFYNSLNAPAFQRNPPLLQTSPMTIGQKSHIAIFATDLLWHF